MYHQAKGGECMSLFEDIKKLSSAEEFFDYFKIPYEEHILKPFRLHILQKFKIYIDSLSVSSEEEAYQKMRDFLVKAYSDFQSTDSPFKERLFKVHQDVVKPNVVFEVGLNDRTKV